MPDIADDPCLPIAARLERATTVAEVRDAALQIDAVVTLLHNRALPVEQIARQVCELNEKVFARLWSLLAPVDLVARSCLVVMGSEGRGEQVFKTDQDNALLLSEEADDSDAAALQALAEQFINALIDCGYPRCPGDIMLSNPLWRQPVAGFKHSLREWMFGADPQGPMRLAIFLDAVAVAGDPALLAQARQFVLDHAVDSDAFFARFARAADQFSEPASWWRRLAARGARKEMPFDLKKLGTFPIVHGVRALALQHRVNAVPTIERMHALVDGHHLTAQVAQHLAEALHLLMTLKLENNLRQRERGETMDNLVRLSSLSPEQRDQLQAALDVVTRFRQYLRLHFNLDAL